MLSAILTYLRKERGLTQEELADELNISRSEYAHYESGKRKPTVEIMIIIADYYTSIDFLLGRTYVRKP
ncbi:MAG: family transcriptional regulator [Clostridiaceae bacterium]|jgi:transcriptional regulator with XRE-family HTH domain|nr:family transcriptional regulator [Clostridiaceae bacterium]